HRALGDGEVGTYGVQTAAQTYFGLDAAQVGLGGGLDAVGAVAEGDQVEVLGQDLVLAQLLVQVQRHPELFDLARGGGRDGGPPLRVVLRRDEELIVLDQLLVDGGGALLDVARREVGQGRADGAPPVHAVVVAEPAVLDRDDRQLHGLRDVLARDDLALLVVQPGDGLTAGVGDRGDGRQVPLDEVRRRPGEGVRHLVGREPGGTRDGEQRPGRDDTRRRTG